MKRKGFTLIELLAVIVILAIIAVITVPKIADMISSSRQGGAEDSFYGTLKAAELGYTKALQSNTNLKGSTCTITDSKITCANGVNVEVSGKTPESGILVIDSAGSTIAKALTLNGYKCYGDLSTSNPCVKSDVEVASETLIKKVTTSGDGLYKDAYEDERYIFRGSNPNNYLTFNEEVWRIVAVENDGTFKIIRQDFLDNNRRWDSYSRYSKNYGTYCSITPDHGCNAWAKSNGIFTFGKYSGSTLEDAELNLYLNNDYYNLFSDVSKKYIQNHLYNTGLIKYGEESDTISTLVNEEKSNTWNGKIGLINPSDVLKSSLNPNCKNIVSSRTDSQPCSDTYLTNTANWWWSINGYYANIYSVIIMRTNNLISYNSGANNGAGSVRPVMYLKANIELTGTGTSSNPYKIKTS